MDKSHEVQPPWGPDEWVVGVLPKTGEIRIEGTRVDLSDLRPDDRFRTGDRVMSWRFDEQSGELGVLIPTDPSGWVSRGLYVQRWFRLEDDRIVPTGHVVLYHQGGDDPLNAKLQEALGLRGISDQVQRHLRVMVRRLGLGEDWERASVAVRRPGRKGMSDLELAQWAERYVEALTTDPKRPYAVLADRYPGWSDSGLKSLVRRARKRGFLSEVGQGQTGGELTAKAEALLGDTTGDSDGKH